MSDAFTHIRYATAGEMRCRDLLLAIFLLTIAGKTAASTGNGVCDNRDAPSHVQLECVVVSAAELEKDGCYTDDFRGGYSVSRCDWRKACVVRAGVALEISCARSRRASEGWDLILFHGNQTFGGSNISFPVAEPSMAGNYECRWEHNDTVFAYRSVTIKDGVYVLPGGVYSDNYEQFCRTNLVPAYIPDYNCSTAQVVLPFTKGGAHRIYFTVLGTAPVNISVGVVWVNHYPVDLHLSWRDQTDIDLPTLQNVTVNSDDVVLIAGTYVVRTYIVITASSHWHSATMCVPLEIHGQDAALFPNESLPSLVRVAEGQSAVFACDAQTKYYGGFAYTVAFLIRSNISAVLGQCMNCSFSPAELLECRLHDDHSSCSEFEYSNSSTGHSNLRNHRLLAHWVTPQPSRSGSEVVCALASHGITQWAHTATLLLLPSSPAPPPPTSSALPSPASSAPPLLVGVVCAVLAMAGVVCVVIGLSVWYHLRHRKSGRHQGLEQIPLADSAQPSSEGTTPTLPAPPAIKVNLQHSSPWLGIETSRYSMDSGLDIAGAVGDHSDESSKVWSGSHLEVGVVSGRSGSLVELESSPPLRRGSREGEEEGEVCVYVSYSDSQEEWVRETLLPLLHSFQPITVTDHEGHMIAGSVISEERLRLVRSADRVIAVVSHDYHQMEWCCYELQHAIQRCPGADGRVIPILCRDCTELPSTIATLHPIFLQDRNWQDKLRMAVHRH